MANYNNYFATEEDAIKILRQEAKKLLRIMQMVWSEYESSYFPAVYDRTGNAYNSMQIDYTIVKVDEETIGIEVTFENDLAWHDSWIDPKKYKQGHAIMLISEGWKVRKGTHANIYRFGYYEGFDFFGKVEAEYATVKHPYISLEFEWKGRPLKKGGKQNGVLR